MWGLPPQSRKLSSRWTVHKEEASPGLVVVDFSGASILGGGVCSCSVRFLCDMASVMRIFCTEISGHFGPFNTVFFLRTPSWTKSYNFFGMMPYKYAPLPVGLRSPTSFAVAGSLHIHKDLFVLHQLN